MHECFVFGPDHEDLAKNYALKIFGDGEGSPPSEVSRGDDEERQASQQDRQPGV